MLRLQRLRQQANDFRRTIEDELRRTRVALDDLRVRDAKRRDDYR